MLQEIFKKNRYKFLLSLIPVIILGAFSYFQTRKLLVQREQEVLSETLKQSVLTLNATLERGGVGAVDGDALYLGIQALDPQECRIDHVPVGQIHLVIAGVLLRNLKARRSWTAPEV